MDILSFLTNATQTVDIHDDDKVDDDSSDSIHIDLK